MAAKKRVSRGTRIEQIVLAVAQSDADDDHDGASFMDPGQRRTARKLAADGYLKIVSDSKAEVVAKLTPKGRKLREARSATPSPRGRVKEPTEGEHLRSQVTMAKSAYHAASTEFQRAKREGPQSAIDAAYRALGEASAAFENAELVLKDHGKKH